MQKQIKAIFNKISTQYSHTNLCAGIKCINNNLDKLAQKMAKIGISANMISVCGFILGMFAVNLLANNMFTLALFFILLNRLCDTLDGKIAKIKGKTEFGVFIDACLDYVFYAAVIFGFALANSTNNALSAAFLLFAFAASACAMLAYAVVDYAKGIKNENVLKESPFYLGGMAQGAETTIAFIVLCLVPQLFVPIAIILGCWCLAKFLLVVSSAYYNFVIATKRK